jgi:hypothetical protein
MKVIDSASGSVLWMYTFPSADLLFTLTVSIGTQCTACSLGSVSAAGSSSCSASPTSTPTAASSAVLTPTLAPTLSPTAGKPFTLRCHHIHTINTIP